MIGVIIVIVIPLLRDKLGALFCCINSLLCDETGTMCVCLLSIDRCIDSIRSRPSHLNRRRRRVQYHFFQLGGKSPFFEKI